jgi:4-alpha-glucanotransferase
VSSLQALASRLGILDQYIDQTGREVRLTSDNTRVALLGAMGIDATAESRIRHALLAIDDREQREIMPPVRVVRESEAWDRTLRFRIPGEVALPNGESRVEYACTLEDERGECTTYAGAVERHAADVVDVGLAPLVGAGYYRLYLALRGRGALAEARQTLVVAPRACVTPAAKQFGIQTNLYSVRSHANWSVGTLADLGTLAEWSASHGASFVGLNPLHAIRNRGSAISPYSPVSRLYRSAAYLQIEDIPELAHSDDARALLASDAVRAELEALRLGTRVEYERATVLARPVLEALHRTFAAAHRSPDDPRRAAYDRYLAREGDTLTAHATFCALDEHFAAHGIEGSWQVWPKPYRVPASSEVADFRAAHREQVDFHRWIQFEIDRQLERAAQRGRDAGLSLGLYHDLAVGSSADGSDAWAHQNLFLSGAAVGAPPDDYATEGQNWGLPPISPHQLHADAYAYWIALIRASLRHAGALRIDHALGMFRQFWIPTGHPGREGAYVRFPTNDLLGILALESARHRAIIVGEDLGTIPPEVPATLRSWGVLGSRVMLFEREHDGAFRPAAAYEPLSLTTADTHDMPPLEGYWTGRDLELGLTRRNDPALAPALAARTRDRHALVDRLTADGILPPGSDSLPGPALVGAVHRFLCSTPAALVGLSLDDITGETDPVNIPGLAYDRYPSWTRRMRLPVESLDSSPTVRESLQCERGAK